MIPCGSQHLHFFSKKYQWIPSVTFPASQVSSAFKRTKPLPLLSNSLRESSLSKLGRMRTTTCRRLETPRPWYPGFSVWCRAYKSLAWTAGRLCSCSWELMQTKYKTATVLVHTFLSSTPNIMLLWIKVNPEQPKSRKDHNHPQPNMKSNPIFRFQLLWGGHECLAVARESGPSNLAGGFHQWNSCAVHSIGNSYRYTVYIVGNLFGARSIK